MVLEAMMAVLMTVGPGPVAKTPAFEVNVLWPFFPGGMSDVKVLLPMARTAAETFRGEAIVGLHSDYAWGPVVRPADAYGKVFILAAKVGWRQFFVSGLHLDAVVHLGWRHEEQNVFDGGTLNGFVGRLWLLAGWQFELSPRWYLNLRGGGGIHLFRTDRHGDKERPFAPGGDVNVGIRF